jgi:spermidine/putrescine transport system substrate-binding protein
MNTSRRLLALVFSLVLVCLAQAKPELNLYAWSEYIPQELIDGFTKETGIIVNYETFASNEEMLAKFQASGGASYDLVQPTDYMAELMIRERMLAKLDRSKIPLLKNIDASLSRLSHDPAQEYTVPYMTGTVGIVINSAAVKGQIKSFNDVFQPKYSGRIVVLNDNREIVTWAMKSLGLGANEVSKENIDRTGPILAKWLPMVKLFDSDSPKTALLNNEVDIGIVWSGEAALLWNQDKKFVYVLPEEGTHQFIDVLAIPAKAKNKEAAHLFINYILRPEVSKLISEKFPYTNPNSLARKLLTQEQLENPASYPKASAKLETFRDIGMSAKFIDKLVTDLKSGK